MNQAAMFNEVMKALDEEALIKFAIDIGQINSPTGHEQEVVDHVLGWMRTKGGFETLRQEAAPGRPNAIGFVRGGGRGTRLLFNSHLDTEWGADEHKWILEKPSEIGYTAHLEGDRIIGRGVANDKGPLAAFCVAAKAVRESKIKLAGDIILTGVCGEIGRAPVDEFQDYTYLGKGLGTRHLVHHGITADYALVAEPSHFCIGMTNTGAMYIKITVTGKGGTYTPWIRRGPGEPQTSAIVKMARVVDALEAWAYDYEQKHRYESPGGTVIPKVNFGAIRGGLPYYPSHTVGVCSIYVDVRFPPKGNPNEVVGEIGSVIEGLGIQAHIQPYMIRRGYDALPTAEPLIRALEVAHQTVFGEKAKPLRSELNSTWNDTNIFNEIGIPSVKYGPLSIFDQSEHTNLFITVPGMFVKDLVNAAKVYALVMVQMCAASS